MKCLHVLLGGKVGGIECLCMNYAKHSKIDNYFFIIGMGGKITQEMKEANINVIEEDINPKKIFRLYKRIISVCVKHDINVIVVHHASPLVHLCMIMLSMFKTNIKIISYAHGNAVDMYRYRQKKGAKIRKKILEISLKSSTQVIAISESVKRSLIECFGISNDKIHVIYNGVDEKHYNRKKAEDDNDKARIIYVGRLIEEKGVQNIIKQLPKIKNDFVFLIVGDGSYKRELERLCDKCLVNNKVEFLGERRDVDRLLAEADIFVHLPEWDEGFGITVIEAMASGCICICNSKGALPEIVKNNENGYLINNSEFASKVDEIIMKKNSSAIKKLISNAISTAQRFSIEEYVNCLDKTLEDVHKL